MFIHISHAVIPALLIGIITSDASQCGNFFYSQEERERVGAGEIVRERQTVPGTECVRACPMWDNSRCALRSKHSGGEERGTRAVPPSQRG